MTAPAPAPATGPAARPSAAGSHEVIVVGGGHNGLVAALRLARAGCRVTVLEQGAEPGGCVWTERHPSGVVVERGAYEHGGILAAATELGLADPALQGTAEDSVKLAAVFEEDVSGLCLAHATPRLKVLRRKAT